MLLHLQSKNNNTSLHVKYVTNSLKIYSLIAVLHNSKGTFRFGDMMMTTMAIIIVESNVCGLKILFDACI